MKKSSTVFLQVVIVLIGIGALALLLWEPQLEGRNAHATLFEIYFKDPFLACVYIGSVPFFVALYQAVKVLGYAGQNKIFSQGAVNALRTIKYCAIVLSLLIVLAGLYIRIFHAEGDDPAGFLCHVYCDYFCFYRHCHRSGNVRTDFTKCRGYKIRERFNGVTRPIWQSLLTSTSCWRSGR